MLRNSPPWICPGDRHPLESGRDGLGCPDCGLATPVADGIADFRNVAEGSSPERSADLEALERLIDELGIEEAAEELSRRLGCRRSGATAEWSAFITNRPSERALEFGAGFGDDTLGLARHGGSVVSITPDLSSARILRRRLKHGRLDVAIAVLRDLTKVPLESESVDTIAVEEIGLQGFGLRRDRLLEVVAEWKRLLKPSGRLVLAQANRLHEIALVQMLRSRIFGGGSPETLNRGVKRLATAAHRQPLGLGATLRCLEAHGFGQPVLYAPLPDSNEIDIVIPVDDAGVVRFCFDQLLRQNSPITRAGIRFVHMLGRLGLLRRLVPHYYVVCPARAGLEDGR